MNSKEIWKEIPGYPRYEISTHGRIKSFVRNAPTILKTSINKRGYLVVGIRRLSTSSPSKVHQLMAITYLDHNPCGHKVVIDHIDGNKLNNHICNLQLITNRENCSKDSKNKSGYVGVCYDRGKYRVSITINKRIIALGRYTDPRKGSKVYQLAIKNIDKYNGTPIEFRDYLKSQL